MANDPAAGAAELLRESLRRQERMLRMMALDIHDGLLQYVIGALYHLESGIAFDPQAEETPPAALREQTTLSVASLDTTRDLLRRAIAEGRRLISGLRPPILVSRGLSAALLDSIEERKAQATIDIELEDGANLTRFSALIEGNVFRIAQEALSNACQHSGSPRVVVRLIEQGDWLRLQVQDWGSGFDKNQIRDSATGVTGMRERAQWLCGVCEISTAPGLGTLVSVELPVSLSASDPFNSP